MRPIQTKTYLEKEGKNSYFYNFKGHGNCTLLKKIPPIWLQFKIPRFFECVTLISNFLFVHLPIGPIRGPPCMASMKLVNRSLFFLLTSILGCCNNNLTCKIKEHSKCIVFYFVIMGNYALYHLLSIEWIFETKHAPIWPLFTHNLWTWFKARR